MKLKCKEELNTNNLYAFLEDYFFKLAPATYNAETGDLQCGERKSRSFYDIKDLVNNYFEEVTENELALALITLCNETNCLRFVACPHIKNLAFYHAKINKPYSASITKRQAMRSDYGWLLGKYDLEDLEKLAGIKLTTMLYVNPEYNKKSASADHNFDSNRDLSWSSLENDFLIENIKNKRTRAVVAMEMEEQPVAIDDAYKGLVPKEAPPISSYLNSIGTLKGTNPNRRKSFYDTAYGTQFKKKGVAGIDPFQDANAYSADSTPKQPDGANKMGTIEWDTEYLQRQLNQVINREIAANHTKIVEANPDVEEDTIPDKNYPF
jgi:hypothetical protein